ncbi:hypothetical protein F2Q69_00022491 [Brassica cretica]|uniref:Uncharacterized protein n=1 Tax=Brassica cretica TaxID=69181 RepID=A0A8S9QNL2_BRACR|nr:hypothetical protein F2Q69_00022491 [Brassica cretica]
MTRSTWYVSARVDASCTSPNFSRPISVHQPLKERIGQALNQRERRQAVPVPRLITSYCILLVVAWYAHSIHITLALAPHGFGTCQSGPVNNLSAMDYMLTFVLVVATPGHEH